jgi:hypothetical protein
MIPNQIGLERADYSAIADTRSTPATGGSARFSSRLIAWLMLLYDFFFWILDSHCLGSQELRSTARMPKKQMASGIPAPEGHLLDCDVQRSNLKAVTKLSLLHLANVKSR